MGGIIPGVPLVLSMKKIKSQASGNQNTSKSLHHKAKVNSIGRDTARSRTQQGEIHRLTINKKWPGEPRSSKIPPLFKKQINQWNPRTDNGVIESYYSIFPAFKSNDTEEIKQSKVHKQDEKYSFPDRNASVN